jgi:hypothetical protein
VSILCCIELYVTPPRNPRPHTPVKPAACSCKSQSDKEHSRRRHRLVQQIAPLQIIGPADKSNAVAAVRFIAAFNWTMCQKNSCTAEEVQQGQAAGVGWRCRERGRIRNDGARWTNDTRGGSQTSKCFGHCPPSLRLVAGMSKGSRCVPLTEATRPQRIFVLGSRRAGVGSEGLGGTRPSRYERQGGQVTDEWWQYCIGACTCTMQKMTAATRLFYCTLSNLSSSPLFDSISLSR